MEISDVRVKLIREPNDRLKAVCSITLDGEFVVRDLKVVDGTQGLFVAMPSRKLSAYCPKCRQKNHLRARFCNDCGGKLPPPQPQTEGDGRLRLHRDIAHPINSTFREVVQARVIEGYHAEAELAGQSENVPTEVESDRIEATGDAAIAEAPSTEPARTEYDSLIAGLNGRADDARSDDQEPSKPEQREKPVRREVREPQPKREEVPVASRSEPEPSRRPVAPGETSGAPAAPSEIDHPSPPPTAPNPPDHNEQGEASFGAGIL